VKDGAWRITSRKLLRRTARGERGGPE
jgi:hypothetical protein